ncbi:SIR2 family NAD-dependent protein deacylase [Flavobacterium gawalongense]|uniref:NAD-dependent protein deacylase n=1 Tax=Flavobacterium gawalongense TaxID=2594432 RepID=A0A553BN56_9FLAO|nr:NAD-dependent deacylase [Flavobacterium gawalongense]TRX00160.1 NAD-dependent deacylase [Flavobacterium gawalongense]TRX04908.1 NAD-dependent deacylase [Flavobacterium gawalongense]TRX09686.1 NAD-dependent deacylase [Flavobacterium gawalongense]TRX10830.1 NAD-dependent deacylase [Flavobacterium gawalongense]TRX28091.1 NAD-dependent deacylase [Flavobacterium gawalongense]
MKKKLVVLTGAGISAESGIKTFRDSDGLWEGHNVMDVATPEGWHKNPALVLDFYNQRRKQLKEVEPNLGHQILAELENHFDVYIITQNVDDLHERAGSSNVLHLHGELLKVRSSKNVNYILDWQDDLNFGDLDDNQNQLRPHIVWFGEEVPALDEAIAITQKADYFAVIGTSLQVYPAAGLIDFTNPETPIYYIDPKPTKIPNLRNLLDVIPEVASEGMKILKKKLTEFI